MLRSSLLFGVAVLCAGACGPTPTVEAPVAPAASISTGDGATQSRPVRTGWRYHPSQMADIIGGLRLGDGSWLLVGELGERWRTEPLPAGAAEDGNKDGPTFFATATVHRAPERLDHVLRWSPRRWLFVGESGTLYSADRALGPLTSSTSPPVKLYRIAGSSRGLVGVDALGQLYRYDGTSWSSPQNPIDRCTGPKPCRRIFDVGATPAGALLGLAIPEQLVSSDDGGQSWTARATAPFGAGRLARSSAGGVVIAGASQRHHWTGTGDPRPVTEDVEQALPTGGHLALLPRRGPSTVAIAEHRAALTGDHYYEVFADGEGRYPVDGPDGASPAARKARRAAGAAGGSSPWRLAAGPLDAPLTVRRLTLTRGQAENTSSQAAPRSPDCEAVRLAAHEAVVLVACMREEGETVVVDLLRSTQRGQGFSRVARLRAPDDDLSLAVAGDGSALVAGACLDPPPAQGAGQGAGNATDCEPRAPILLPSGRAAKPAVATAGDLTDRATSVAFARDGQAAYFFGRRAKDERIALFVSRDGGATFASRPLVAPKGAPQRWDVEREAPRSVQAAADGSIGLVLGSHPPAYVVADQDGRITSVARLPGGVTAVAGHGDRVLAVGPNPDPDDGPLSVVAWESTDGGLSFRRLGLPTKLWVDELDEPLSVACGAAGCVLGSRLTRVGWNLPDSDPPQVRSPQGGADRPLQPAVRTPLSCAVDVKRGWTTVADVRPPVLPSASQVMRGTSFWSILRHDDTTGEVTALSLPVGARGGRLSREQLLGKARNRDRYGVYVARQMEGYAAARVALPAKRADEPGHPIVMDVGWTNYQTATRGRATLDQLGALAAEDVTPRPRPHLLAGLLSVSPRGLFVRPSATRPDTVVVNLAGQITHRGDYPSWPAVNATESHSDAVLVARSPVAVGMFAPNPEDADTTVALAPLGTAAASPAFFRVAPDRGYDRFVGTWWTYRGDEVGLVTHVIDVDRVRGYATFTPFTASGGLAAPIPVPTQLDLPARAQACTGAERSGTPRINAPFVPGTRHPVLLQGAVDSHVLLTERMILHGTPQAPCVAALFARELRRPGGPLVAVLSGDLKQAWLFRETPGKERSLDYRPLSCQPSPGATVPARVWNEPGMVRR